MCRSSDFAAPAHREQLLVDIEGLSVRIHAHSADSEATRVSLGDAPAGATAGSQEILSCEDS